MPVNVPKVPGLAPDVSRDPLERQAFARAKGAPGKEKPRTQVGELRRGKSSDRRGDGAETVNSGSQPANLGPPGVRECRATG